MFVTALLQQLERLVENGPCFTVDNIFNCHITNNDTIAIHVGICSSIHHCDSRIVGRIHPTFGGKRKLLKVVGGVTGEDSDIVTM